MNLFGKDLAVDLGTTSVTLSAKDGSILLREPTVVAVDRSSGKLLKTGMAAQRMLGRTPANIVAIEPIRAGVICDYGMTERMLQELVKKVTSFSLLKPCIIIGIPSNISEVEERAVIDAGIEAGARKVYLMEAAKAAAYGAGIDFSGPNGTMVVDIGGGTTDIAVLSLSGVVESNSLEVGGNDFDEAVIKYIKNKYEIMIGGATAREIKHSIGCVYPRSDAFNMDVKGRSLQTGLPQIITVGTTEMLEAMEELADTVVEAIIRMLEITPPELVGDIAKNGITLTGGGSLLWGFADLINSRTNIPVHVADDAPLCVAYGLSKALGFIDQLNEGTLNIERRRNFK